jgi:tRNA (guanine37-N1)-methyltransferase
MDFRGHGVQEILLSGNHEAISQWRRKEALRRTVKKRPDLLAKANLSDTDKRFIDEILQSEGTRTRGDGV